MPPQGEQVNPKPLSAKELKTIMLADLSARFDRDCVFNENQAFGKVRYEITYKMHFDNLSFPENSGTVTGQDGAPPLEETEISTATVAAGEVAREIESPTQVRVEHGLPVPVVVAGEKGRTSEKEVRYPADAAQKGKVTDTDRKDEAVREFTERKRTRKPTK